MSGEHEGQRPDPKTLGIRFRDELGGEPGPTEYRGTELPTRNVNSLLSPVDTRLRLKDFYLEGLDPEISRKMSLLSKIAEDDALAILRALNKRDRTQPQQEAIDKILATIKERFRPFIAEDLIVADQISTREFLDFIDEQFDFFGGEDNVEVRVGLLGCSDDRLLPTQMLDPGVGHAHRRLQGMPNVNKYNRIDDPLVISGLDAAIESIDPDKRASAEFIEFVGPHIDSHSLVDHGCGAAQLFIRSVGRAVKDAMKFWGGIHTFFTKLGKGFNAFNNTLSEKGVKGTTFDMVQDTYSQGLIFGLREIILNHESKFDKTRPFRNNLRDLHRNGDIVVTEFLAETLERTIEQTAIDIERAQGRRLTEKLDLDDPRQFGRNMMLIGRVAKELTRQYEASGFSELRLPKHLTDGKSPTAIRVLAYHIIRNCAYQVLGDIIPGQHNLIEHRPESVRVGPTGGTHHRQELSLIYALGGRLSPDNHEEVMELYKIFENYARNSRIDLTQEGRLILATASVSIKDRIALTDLVDQPTGYWSRDEAGQNTWIRSDRGDDIYDRFEDGLVNAAVTAFENATQLREAVIGRRKKTRKTLLDGTKTGNAITLATLHDSRTKAIEYVVTRGQTEYEFTIHGSDGTTIEVEKLNDRYFNPGQDLPSLTIKTYDKNGVLRRERSIRYPRNMPGRRSHEFDYAGQDLITIYDPRGGRIFDGFRHGPHARVTNPENYRGPRW